MKAKTQQILIHGDGPLVADTRVGRNSPCPCKSGKKFKNCCIYKEKKYFVKDKPKTE